MLLKVVEEFYFQWKNWCNLVFPHSYSPINQLIFKHKKTNMNLLLSATEICMLKKCILNRKSSNHEGICADNQIKNVLSSWAGSLKSTWKWKTTDSKLMIQTEILLGDAPKTWNYALKYVLKTLNLFHPVNEKPLIYPTCKKCKVLFHLRWRCAQTVMSR